MPTVVDNSEKITSLNNAWVFSAKEGFPLLEEIKRLGGTLDPNGNLKKSLDGWVVGGLPDDLDGAIDSLNNLLKEEEERFRNKNEQINKDKLDELVREYEEAKAKGEENEATLKEIQDILDREPSLATKNIRDFIETQTRIREEKVGTETEKADTSNTVIENKTGRDVVFEGKIQNLNKGFGKTGVIEGELINGAEDGSRVKVDLQEARIVDEKTAIEALIQLKKTGRSLKGSSIEKKINRILGKRVPNEDIALSVLRNNLDKKIKSVENQINEISKRLTVDPKKQELVRGEIEEIVTGEKILPEEELTKLLAEASSDGEITTELEVAAKEAVKTAKGVLLKDSSSVRLYRSQKIEDEIKSDRNLTAREKELMKGGLISGELSEKDLEFLKKGLLNRKRKLVNEVISAAEMENQGQVVAETFKDKGNTALNFRRVESTVGLQSMSEKERESIFERNEKINSELSRFKMRIPYTEISALALDDVSAALKNEKIRSLDKSRIFGRTKVNFYQFVNGQKRIQSKNGFVEKIGKMSTGEFVNKSMRVLSTGDNVEDSIGRIYVGIENGKFKSMPTGTNGIISGFGNETSNGFRNLSVNVGNFLKNSLGDLASRLSPGLKRGIGNGATSLGRGIVKTTVNGVSLASSLGGFKIKAAIAISTGVLIAIILGGAFAGQQLSDQGLLQAAWMWDENAVESTVNTVYEDE